MTSALNLSDWRQLRTLENGAMFDRGTRASDVEH